MKQLLAQVKNIRFFYLAMVFTVEDKTFESDDVGNCDEKFSS
jgi:hypothetical protein